MSSHQLLLEWVHVPLCITLLLGMKIVVMYNLDSFCHISPAMILPKSNGKPDIKLSTNITLSCDSVFSPLLGNNLKCTTTHQNFAGKVRDAL